jgi:quinol monooxygenase YgiN
MSYCNRMEVMGWIAVASLLVSAFLATCTCCDAFSLSITTSGKHPYCMNLKCTVKESRRDDFLSLIKENQFKTLQDEPEALQYVVGEDVDSPNTCYIHEQFASADGFAYHRNTPHNANWHKFKASDPFIDEPVTNFFYGKHEATAKAPMRDAFCLNVQLCIDPKYREEFLEVIINNSRGANENEPLCLQYDWGEDCNEPNTFHFHEQYTGADGGKEGFTVHTVADHFRKWEEFAAIDPFTKPPLVAFFRTLP